MEADVIDKLAEKIASYMSPRVPAKDMMWSITDIANYLNYSTRTVRGFVKRGDFPPSYRIKAGYPRWKACDVKKWTEQFRGKEVAI